MARIELGAGDYALRSLLNNKDAVGIGIFQAPGSNALAALATVRETMDELKKNFPQGVEYRSSTTRRSSCATPSTKW